MTANSSTSRLLQINPLTGAATVVGTFTASASVPILDTLAVSPPGCVHKSSLVSMADGTFSALENIQVSSGHLCLVFEPNSISRGVPNARFAVDPGHPICAPRDYAEKGHLALRMARVWGLQAQPGTVHMITWKEVDSFFDSVEVKPGDSRSRIGHRPKA